MEKYKIQLFNAQAFQTAIDKLFHIFCCIPICCVRIQSSATFSYNKEAIFMLCNKFADSELAVTIIINVSCINQIYTTFITCFKDFLSFCLVKRITPLGAKLPGSKANFTDHSVCFT